MRTPVPALIAALAATIAGCRPGARADLSTFSDSASYAVGMNVARSLDRAGAELDVPALLQGLSDGLDGEPLLADSVASTLLDRLTTRLEETATQRHEELMTRNLQEGEAYRTRNAERAGVTTTTSGLQYEVLAQGSGARPRASDRVTVHYRGTLIDGTEFDSSYRRGSPATFPLNRVISGWTEGLQLMSVGSKYRLVLPPELGYGQRGSPPDIGPNATLIFEVELLGIDR
jgi:FKBP-type peptidyl-prolyl cis-trans isomerase